MPTRRTLLKILGTTQYKPQTAGILLETVGAYN